MRSIIAKELTESNFSMYGTFCNLLEQGTNNRSAFFPDRITWTPKADVGASVGYACPCEMKIPWYEYHAATAEVRLPLDGDIVIYVSTPEIEPDTDKFEAFIVPMGTMIRLNPGVVHGRQFPVGNRPVHILLLSEAATYENDVHVWQVANEDSITIKLTEHMKEGKQ